MKEIIKLKEYPTYTLYLHIFPNGNSYKECENNWSRTDFSNTSIERRRRYRKILPWEQLEKY